MSQKNKIREPSGNITGTYTQEAGNTNLSEQPIYASGRIGMAAADGSGTINTYSYELTDHLGNVRATFGKTSDGLLSINTATDYYPFGMEMDGRIYQDAENYRFGYQGQFAEKDDETGYSQFELRLYDARIGRWLSTDPYHVHWSPYLGMANNPVGAVDPDGGSPLDWFKNKDGRLMLVNGEGKEYVNELNNSGDGGWSYLGDDNYFGAAALMRAKYFGNPLTGKLESREFFDPSVQESIEFANNFSFDIRPTELYEISINFLGTEGGNDASSNKTQIWLNITYVHKNSWDYYTTDYEHLERFGLYHDISYAKLRWVNNSSLVKKTLWQRGFQAFDIINGDFKWESTDYYIGINNFKNTIHYAGFEDYIK